MRAALPPSTERVFARYSSPTLSRLTTALLAGAALPFAFAPYYWWPVAVVSLAVWVGLLAPSRTHHSAPFSISLSFGCGWFITGSWWLAATFHHYGHLPWLAAIAFQLLIGTLLALYPALLGWSVARLAGRSPLLLMLLFSPLTLLEEWIRGHLFTGLPWVALGNLMVDTPWIGWGSTVGGLGLSLVAPMLAAALWGITQTRLRRSAATILLCCVVLAITAPTTTTPHQPRLHVALIQPNIAQDQKWSSSYLLSTMQQLRELSLASAPQADLIVWPEAATPFFLSTASGWYQWLTEQVAAWQTPLLFGGLKEREDGSAANGAWLLTDQSVTLPPFVGKHHLVPFGEYVPSWIPWLHKLVPDIGEFRPSHDSGTLTLSREIKIGVLICYESIFADEMRARIQGGATLLTVLTNDAWYDRSPAAWQHLQAAQMRAVESRRFVLRAANTGISAVIAPDGTIRDTIEWWQQGALNSTVTAINTITPYCRYGDWPILLLVILYTVALRWRFASLATRQSIH
ncbi:MAG: apolipoprotein N-acyltransferase [Mariprofundales bacterium]|nr:apolipoprotein N-acyltransferase [Mariprofundales bacterium]